MKKKAKFKVGDWVCFVGGEFKGKTTTLTSVYPKGDGFYYVGFFCGNLIGGDDEQTEKY